MLKTAVESGNLTMTSKNYVKLNLLKIVILKP